MKKLNRNHLVHETMMVLSLTSCFFLHLPVYHFQFRIQFFTRLEKIDPSLTIKLTGTREESETLPITLYVPIQLTDNGFSHKAHISYKPSYITFT